MTSNAIPDLPRLYTALAEWLSCLIIVLSLNPNIKRKKFVTYSIFYLVLLIAFMEITATVVIWLWLPCMLIAFFSMTAFIFFCTKSNYYESVYYAVLAFSSAECMASVEWQLVNYTYKNVSQMPLWVEITVLVFAYSIMVLIIYNLFTFKDKQS